MVLDSRLKSRSPKFGTILREELMSCIIEITEYYRLEGTSDFTFMQCRANLDRAFLELTPKCDMVKH